MARLDDCGVCFGGLSTILVPGTLEDCEGVCKGFALVDVCGVCSMGTTGILSNSTLDCHGECDGRATLDSCGVCAGGGTNVYPNADKDCTGNDTTYFICVGWVIAALSVFMVLYVSCLLFLLLLARPFFFSFLLSVMPV
jgi:hypothetical protein